MTDTTLQNTALHYTIVPADPAAHLFQVTLAIQCPLPEGFEVRLPAWIPGSYMIRDFARHILHLQAHCEAGPVGIESLDKQTWSITGCDQPVTLSYQVYAWDLSVRAAHLDQTHGYFNGTSVFLEVPALSDQPCAVTLEPPLGLEQLGLEHGWQVATALSRVDAPEWGFGTYRAENYATLIDHPVEMGTFEVKTFMAAGVEHAFVLTGLHHADLDRVGRDLERICTTQIEFFGAPAPFERYLFLTWAVGNGYGGLEHRASTSLICKRDDLPAPGAKHISEGYLTFLGLCSHEYFHSWNVKRIQPDIPYDLSQENYTPLLWAFEGITSYYDNLMLVRSGLISVAQYLDLLGKDFTRLIRNPGRRGQSIAQSSFDAWTRFYQQDENAANAIVSYYTKGALVALCLDLKLRAASAGAVTLDTVMLRLWQEHGLTGTPVAEETIQTLCESLLAQADVGSEAIQQFRHWLDNAIYGTIDPDFAETLATVGIQWHQFLPRGSNDNGGGKPPTETTQPPRLDLGIVIQSDSVGVKVARVMNGSSAHQAGLSAGDCLIALNRIQVQASNFDALLQRYQPGDTLTFHAFRRDELMQFNAIARLAEPATVALAVSDQHQAEMWLQPASAAHGE